MLTNKFTANETKAEDLRERMRLLQQDRRANVNLLESKQAANIEEIRCLRAENKALRSRTAQLQKYLDVNDGTQNETEVLKRELVTLRMEYDSIKVETVRRSKQLEKLRDELQAFDVDTLHAHCDDPTSRKVQMLENRLDDATIKYNEAQSIRGTYEHIVKRLKEERISFDNQLTALERTLKAKDHDYEELVMLSNDANHAREVAQNELRQARNQYIEKKEKRDAALRERRQVVRIRKQILEKKELIDQKRSALISPNADISLDSDECYRTSLHAGAPTESKEAIREREQKVEAYETAFRRLKCTTGGSDTDVIIERVLGQENTTANLFSLTKNNQIQIDRLVEIRTNLKSVTENKKYNSQTLSVNKKTADEKEQTLQSSFGELERSRNKYEKLSNILIRAKAGVGHLQDQLDGIRSQFHFDKHLVSDTNLADVLWSIGNVLVEVRARIRDYELTRLSFHDNGTLTKVSTTDITETTRMNNQRVILPSFGDRLYLNDCGSDAGMAEMDDDEISRGQVKRASSQIIQAQERKKVKDREKA